MGTEASEPARGALGAGRRTNRWGQIEEIALATRHPARGFQRIDDVLVDGGGQHGDGATPIRDLEALAAADSTQGGACVLLQLSHADLLHVRQCSTTEPLGTKTELHRVEFDSRGVAALKVQAGGGRRTVAATVPPPAPRAPAAAAAKDPEQVFNLLRAMAEPAYSGMSKAQMSQCDAARDAYSNRNYNY